MKGIKRLIHRFIEALRAPDDATTFPNKPPAFLLCSLCTKYRTWDCYYPVGSENCPNYVEKAESPKAKAKPPVEPLWRPPLHPGISCPICGSQDYREYGKRYKCMRCKQVFS